MTKSTPKQTLAARYFPFSSQPGKMLRRWLNENPKLMDELRKAGYNKRRKTFLPKHIAIIRKHMGDPEID